MQAEQPDSNYRHREFPRPEAWAIVGGVAIPIVAYFVLPAIPQRDRAEAGLAFGALFFLLAIVFLMKRFGILQSKISEHETKIETILTNITRDPATGIIHMGAVRNVSLRAATVHKLVNELIDAVPKTKQVTTLHQAGKEIGRDWGRTFLEECKRTHVAVNTIDQKLELWSSYDAQAGMGRIDFSISEVGHGSVTLSYGFLSDSDSVVPLDYFFEGYLEGALEEVLKKQLKVELKNPLTHSHDEATFIVAPSKESEVHS